MDFFTFNTSFKEDRVMTEKLTVNDTLFDPFLQFKFFTFLLFCLHQKCYNSFIFLANSKISVPKIIY